MDKYRTRNKGIKKEIWFSICSKHYIYEDSCNLCRTGFWKNAIKYKTESFIYYLFPRLWRWWVNK